MTTIGQHIQIRRGRLGWTQEQLARRAGVTMRTVQNVEAGRSPSMRTMTRLAKALRVSIRRLQAVSPWERGWP